MTCLVEQWDIQPNIRALLKGKLHSKQWKVENFERNTKKTVHYTMLLLKCITKELFGGFNVLWPTRGKYVTGEMTHVWLSNYNLIWQTLKWRSSTTSTYTAQYPRWCITSLLMNCDRIFTICKEETSPNPKFHDTFVWPRNLQHTTQNYMLFDNCEHCASENGKTLDSVQKGPVHKIKWMN